MDNDKDKAMAELLRHLEEVRGKTWIPVLKKNWSQYHGIWVKEGALTAKTDTDYLFFTCVGCKEKLAGGAGIRLEGASDDFASLRPKEKQVLVFRIWCPLCGFQDHFKIALDHTGLYGTPSRDGD